MRILVTGVTGFAARHLVPLLQAERHEVFGTTRRAPTAAGDVLPADRVVSVGLDDVTALAAVVRDVAPDGIFHLAAVTSVRGGDADPAAAYGVNVVGSVNLFAAVREAAPRCRVLWVGSATAYGAVRRDELPITESQPFRPMSTYATSKAAADLAAYQWAKAEGLHVVRVRPFNHAGPGQSAHFVCAELAKQVIEIERGLRPPTVATGNLDVVRDFSDVRDVVRAYVLAWQRGESGEAYNVCGGIGRTVRSVVRDMLRLAKVQAAIQPDPARQRGADTPVIIGDAELLRRVAGWKPVVPWDQTLRDVLDDWRDRVGLKG